MSFFKRLFGISDSRSGEIFTQVSDQTWVSTKGEVINQVGHDVSLSTKGTSTTELVITRWWVVMAAYSPPSVIP